MVISDRWYISWVWKHKWYLSLLIMGPAILLNSSVVEIAEIEFSRCRTPLSVNLTFLSSLSAFYLLSCLLALAVIPLIVSSRSCKCRHHLWAQWLRLQLLVFVIRFSNVWWHWKFNLSFSFLSNSIQSVVSNWLSKYFWHE